MRQMKPEMVASLRRAGSQHLAAHSMDAASQMHSSLILLMALMKAPRWPATRASRSTPRSAPCVVAKRCALVVGVGLLAVGAAAKVKYWSKAALPIGMASLGPK